MILPDWYWERWGGSVVRPYREDQINPHSYDLLLGSTIRLQRYRGAEFPDTLAELDSRGTMVIRGAHTGEAELLTEPFLPGDSVLAETVETLSLPRWVRATGYLKSSVSREGLNHRTSMYVDAGFRGSLTLALEFARSGWLLPGRRIIQLEAQVVLPRRSYSARGSYRDQAGPTVNRSRSIAFQASVSADHERRPRGNP